MAINDTTPITIASLTGGERQGAGSFEELMRAIKSHLVEEHKAGRITGDNYTQAYISSLNSAMNTAAQYTLQYEITNQQIRLLDEQIASGKLQTDLIAEQIEKIKADTLFVQKQTVKLDSDIELVDAQVASQTKQLELMDSQLDNLEKDLLVKDTQIGYQEAQENMVVQQTSNELTRNAQIISQTNKIDAEQAILLQRAITEEAQTVGDEGTVGGILGKQMELYQNQADGYIRDSEQKAAKIMNDTFITTMTTGEDDFNRTIAGVDDTEVGKVMTVLKTGINVT